MEPTRREFPARLLGSAITFGLVEMLWSRDLFADAVKPTIDKWLRELVAMTKDLRGRKLTDLRVPDARWRTSTSGSTSRPCARSSSSTRSRRRRSCRTAGPRTSGFDLSKVEGLPANVGFGKQIFGCKKGRSIVPHGHANMCTGFIVLKGKWHGRHYDRVETHADHYVIKPTIDREFEPGELSTISDHKDNIHWFKAGVGRRRTSSTSTSSGTTRRSRRRAAGCTSTRTGEKLSGGLVKAPKMTSAECHKKYG